MNLGKPKTTATVTEIALRKAFALGQTYWQLADSDFTSDHRKSDEVKEQFEALVAQVT